MYRIQEFFIKNMYNYLLVITNIELYLFYHQQIIYKLW